MNDDDIDWDKTTWEGSRREQLRRWRALTLRERLLAVEEMAELSAHFRELRAQRKLQFVQTGSEGSVGVNRGYINEVREPQAQYGENRNGNEITLSGCTPTPLANYLKALGVLRLLSARDPQVKGAWRGELFILRTALSRSDVENFFLNDYQPTPVMAPWNGGSGFFDKDNKIALQAVNAGKAARLKPYRESLSVAEAALVGADRSASPKGEAKQAMLARIRGVLSDEALSWFDAAVLMSGDETRYPPLLGTGGNDGRLDFTNNFMQRVLDVMDADTGKSSSGSAGWLRAALFGEVEPGLVKSAIGQFAPGQAGGPNASTGFEADSTMNPWDFVLMLEGALLFAAAAVRRNAEEPFGVLSYPFTVRAVGAGPGNIGSADAADARGELWMPLWEQLTSYAEVRALLAEGRIALGKKPARDALDFVRAVHQFGSYRGIRSFQRYGLLMRSGKAYLATPLERVEVSDAPQTNPLDELDKGGWLERFRRFAQGENVSNKVQSLRGQLETAFFRLSGKVPTPAEVQAVLVLLGEIQAVLSVSKKAQEAKVHEMPRLSERWVQMADDKTPAFRIARARAGTKGREDDKPQGLSGARLDDVLASLRDDAMDSRIATLFAGLSLCTIPPDTEHETGEGAAPAAFALLKLCLTSDATLRKLGYLSGEERIPVPRGMLAQLAAGNAGNRAVAAAWRRLRASGLSPAFDIKSLPTLDGLDPRRVAAGLQIPLRFGATAALARSVLKMPEPQAESA